ncbi:MAG: transglycosylase SLT domain-containing protein [Solitalea sp.]
MAKRPLYLFALSVYLLFSSFAFAAAGAADEPVPSPAEGAPVNMALDSLDTIRRMAGDSVLTREPRDQERARLFGHVPLYKRQLDSIQNMVPLTYNEVVESYIDQYVHRRKGLISRMMGLSEYYFPIFEQALKEKGLPVELKYLSIVESALNPNAVSRVGATGLWQFMYTTAREYGLQMNSYIDERRDPVAASQAAAEYLSNMYGRYGDWLLAIASYNCGPGNVERAIHKAGGKLDFWAIRPYLPQETRNYVPAYIAVTYLMNYAEEHEIHPAPPELAVQCVPVQIEKHISLSSLSRQLDMEAEQLYLLNPKYRRRIVNGSGAHPQTVWLPPVKAELYASLQRGEADPKVLAASDKKETDDPEPVYYTVRKGDNLTAIANRFRCSVQDLKVWNDLAGTRLVPGQRLMVTSGEAADQPQSRTYLVRTYKVQRGDTLSGIAARFGTSVAVLKELNGIRNATALRAGKIIKVNPEG